MAGLKPFISTKDLINIYKTVFVGVALIIGTSVAWIYFVKGFLFFADIIMPIGN